MNENLKFGIKDYICIFLIIVFLFGINIPSGPRQYRGGRETARRISCTSNLKQIGLAIRVYSQEYKGEFPPYDGAKGLEMLRSGGYLENVKMYTCPSTTDNIIDNNEITDKNCSYGYRGGLNEKSPLEAPLAWDKPENHRKYGNILYVDGHTAGFAGADWISNLKGIYTVKEVPPHN
ncbi:MAG TPA: hypothetical protein DCZ94_11680 [Lentisphaeria bacterium]|nr:MAG: hypothetical protein A2X48_00470 [Lentisphaerae bacterium GWF2_49_21]HBC87607.1 hypothetical protein [Lentisphaeria bacterium]